MTLRTLGSKTIATTLSKLVNVAVKAGLAENVARKRGVWTGTLHAWLRRFPTSPLLWHAWAREGCLACIKPQYDNTLTENNTEDGQHANSSASQVLTVTHLTPSNENEFCSSGETRSGQCCQHKSLIPRDNFRLLRMQSSVRLTFCYYPWTPRHQLIITPYNLLYCWLCRVASDLHSPQHTVDSKPLNLVEWRAEGANLIGRLTFASSVWSLDRKCQWWRVSICVWVCSRSLWTKLAGHVSARAQVSPITRAILLHVIEVTLCRITKLHNAQVSRLRVCVAGQRVSKSAHCLPGCLVS